MTTTWHPLERLRPVREQSLAPRFNPLQAIAPALGVLALLGGLIAIGHSGFHAEHVFEPHDALAGLHYTPLLAACAMGFGVAMLLGAELVHFGRSRIRVFGDVALGLGIVVLTAASSAAIGLGAVVLADLWPRQLEHALNIDQSGGVIAVILGSAGLLAAVTAPLTARRATAPSLAPTSEGDPPPATTAGTVGNADTLSGVGQAAS